MLSSSRSSRGNRTIPKPLHRKFKVESEENIFKYTLPEIIAGYANQTFEYYALEKELKSSILVKNPVPNNIDTTEKLDEVLRDKHQTIEIKLNKILEIFKERYGMSWVNYPNSGQ